MTIIPFMKFQNKKDGKDQNPNLFFFWTDT